jgi:5-formyltetrahydrofolate cyclo-ligase
MISGFSFTELILVFVVILIFTGSKGMAQTAKDLGRLFATLRKYKEKFEREMHLLSISDDLKKEVENKKRIQDQKDELRSRVKTELKAQPVSQRDEESKIIMEKLLKLEQLKDAKTICCFVSTDYEVQTDPIINHFLKENVGIAVPWCKTKEKELGVSLIKDLASDLGPGAYGIREPIQEKRVDVKNQDIDAVIIPGVVFDKELNRMGNGKGYYDRFLQYYKGSKPIIALAFDLQILDQDLHADPYDIKPDLIITEKRILDEKEYDRQRAARDSNLK